MQHAAATCNMQHAPRNEQNTMCIARTCDENAKKEQKKKEKRKSCLQSIVAV